MAVIAVLPTEPSRRWSDPEAVTKHTSSFEMTYWAILGAFIFAGLAQGASAYTMAQHTSEIARQAQIQQYQAVFLKRVCEMYQHRDTAMLRHNAIALQINARFASQLPKGYAVALDSLITQRDADVFTIEKVDCSSTPPSPAPSSLFSSAP